MTSTVTVIDQAPTLPGLFGRTDETAVLDDLLDAARDGTGDAVVVHGEAGIGKSALLDHVAERAGEDAFLLRGSAVETEAELPFAGLHLLLRPVVDRIDELPDTQARALRCALGVCIADGKPDGRFAIDTAVTTLITLLAAERPVVCVVDDAHWLDQPSAEALLFAARRAAGARVLFAFAARDDHAPEFAAPGLRRLGVGGLTAQAADALLSDTAADLPRHVRDQVSAEARGNPLALLELSAALREGRFTPYGVAPVPTHGRLRRAFADRITALPESTRTLLLVAAADGTCDTGTVLAAAASLGASADDLDTAERAGLLMFSDTCIGFRHPLGRSTVYQQAPLPRRFAAHRALAAALTRRDPDRRAWHLASATTGEDEDVAKELEASAEHARARHGYGAVAAAYERAAMLSPDPDDGGRRLVEAARAAADAGQPERACELAHRASAQLTCPVERAKAAMVHALLAERSGEPGESHRILVRAAGPVTATAPELAGRLLFAAADAAWVAGDGAALDATVAMADGLPGAERVRTLHRAATAEVPDAVRAVRELSAAPPHDCADRPLALRGRTVVAAQRLSVGDDAGAHDTAADVVRDARTDTVPGALPSALAVLARARLRLGRPDDAESAAREGLELAQEIGQASAPLAGVLAAHAALRGDEPAVRALAATATNGDASGALALLDLGLGRHEAALDRLTTRFDALDGPDRLRALDVVPDLVEAAVRARRPEDAEGPLATYVAFAAASGEPSPRALALRCQALLGRPELFERALAVPSQRPFELARTRLLHGEWLRRERRKTEARTALRSALEVFDRLGAAPWAERARTELRATGERLGRHERSVSAVDDLTPQELRVARLAAEGLTNRDIGTRLFLSPRTVGYHLHKAYPKLGVASRGELANLELGDDD